MPLSIVGTFAVMYLAGFSLNNLTLMALTIATGFVIDDAIVVVENIQRHIDDGMKPLDAALLGLKEIGFTIVSLTFPLIAVLIPLLFMGDVVGRLFREFSITPRGVDPRLDGGVAHPHPDAFRLSTEAYSGREA